MRELLIATRNAHKTHEIAAILGTDWKVSDLTSLTDRASVVESGETFEENAILKAVHASRFFDGLVLADDSGLEVEALDGAPGIRSARYAGESASDEENRLRLLEAMRSVANRSARFCCVLALARKGRVIRTFRGVVEGNIAAAARGNAGFGYDPIFVPRGYDQTFGELPEAVKLLESHRAHALAAARQFLLGIENGYAESD